MSPLHWPAPTSAAVERVLWRHYAAVYDALLGLTSYRWMIARVVDATEIRPGHCVVEVGAGTGNVMAELAAASPSRLIGIDSSAEMLSRAEAKIRGAGQDTQVELCLGDAVEVLGRLPAGSVDRLVAVNFLYVLPDRSRFWAEAARVLAPGGRLVAAHTDRAGFGPVVREHVQADGVRGLLRPRLLAVGLFDLLIDAVQRHGRFQFSSFEELVAEASAAGLGEAEHLGRCYGGDEDGVNVLTRFSATSTPLRVPGTASPTPIPDDRLNQPTAASIT